MQARLTPEELSAFLLITNVNPIFQEWKLFCNKFQVPKERMLIFFDAYETMLNAGLNKCKTPEEVIKLCSRDFSHLDTMQDVRERTISTFEAVLWSASVAGIVNLKKREQFKLVVSNDRYLKTKPKGKLHAI